MSRIELEARVVSQEVFGVNEIDLERKSSKKIFKDLDVVFGGFKSENPSGECPFEGKLKGHLRRYESQDKNMRFAIAHVDNSLVVTTAVSEKREGFYVFNRGIAELVQQVLEEHCGSCDVSPRGKGTCLTIGRISSEKAYNEVEPVLWNVLSYPYLGGEIVVRK